MTNAIAMVTTDSTDPLPLAEFWATVTGGEIVAENEGWFVVVQTPSLRLGFQRVEEVAPGKNRLHLDLAVEGDLTPELERLLAAGATLVGHRTQGDFGWVTLADPQGNEFCIAAGE
ncbi:VOC family protein [Serinibacter salmoneus]|uniref:VOC domain-containing protein n=1 Tax=Serinibacter salmoneus TaxID=556530 RepID=A0A2A9D019_9MICO|nr:VOC family protein [Serinibacter salmoneus]PFG20014.1 hypothetical protein ATL40_1597 [Serinibacter salmoneus]